MDLSKLFDCIPNDLPIAKLYAYRFSFEALPFLNSYLRNGKQCVKLTTFATNIQRFFRCTTGLYTRSDII